MSLKKELQFLTLVIIIVCLVQTLYFSLTGKKRINNISKKKSYLYKIPGSFQCNKYKEEQEENHDGHFANTPFAMCRFENICLNGKGQFILTKLKDSYINEQWFHKYNGKTWIYAQGSVNTNRGNVPIFLKDGVLEYDEKHNSLYLYEHERKVEISVSKDFHFIKGSSFALYRYAAGNAGHVLTENLAMTISQMLSFDDVTLNNHIIFLEDALDFSKPNGYIASYGYEQTVDKFSIEWFSLISNNPIKQLCQTEDGFKIVNATCRNVPSNVVNEEVVACFEKLYIGNSVSNLHFPIGREVMNPTLRNLIYEKLKLPLVQLFSQKKKFTIVLQKKKLESFHGMIISNIDDIVKYLKENIPKDLTFQQSGKELQVLAIQLEDKTTNEQIYMLNDLDVYITTHGSGGYLSLLVNDKSLVIQAPLCTFETETGRKVCSVNSATLTYAHTQILHYLDLIPHREKADCKPRPLESKQCNCDPILDPELISRAVLGHFKSMYSSS